jgi:hypothetical protein
LTSHNFCFQTVLFCVASFQFWHWLNLTASSFTPSSHLNLVLPLVDC